MNDSNSKNYEDELDFSKMSFNDFLASVHADLGDLPQAQEAEKAEEPDMSQATRVIPPVTPPKPQPAPSPKPKAAPRPQVDPDEPTGELPVLPRKEAQKAEKVKKGGPDKRLLIGGVIALVVVIAAVAGFFIYRSYQESKALSQPDAAVERFLASTSESYWLEGVRAAAHVTTTEFEDEETIVDQFLLSQLRGQEITYHRADAYTDAAPVYILSAGGVDFCHADLSLGEENSAGFGFTLWNVTTVELLEDFLRLDTRSIQLNVKEDVDIYLNGVEVSASYALPDEDDHIATYVIDGIYADYSLEVYNAEGELEEALSSSGDSYSYPVPGKMEFSFSITVPEGTGVLVGDVSLGSEEETGRDPYPVYGDLEELLDSGLLDEETSQALAEAMEALPSSIAYTYSVYDYEQPTVGVTPALNTMVTIVELEDGSYYGTPGSDAQPEEELSQRAEKFMRLYVNFVANVGGDTSKNLSDISPYLLKNSALYDRIYKAMDSNDWSGSGSVSYHYMQLTDFITYGDVLATCRVSFGLTKTIESDECEVEKVYDLALLLVDDAWRVVSMQSVK